MSETYSVVITGKIAANYDMATVKANVGKVFRLNEAQLKKIFCGKPVVLRRGIRKDQATKLRAVLINAGALAVVKVSKSAATPVHTKKAAIEQVATPQVTLTCPRCAHEQPFATACGMCKMDLSLHIQRLKRRAQVRKVYQQRQVGSVGR